MFKARVITPQEFEQIAVDYETAKSNVVSAHARISISRKQALEDATVKAPAEGTIIDKTVSEGTVIASANGSVSGGTTIIKMADLGVVRIRALFNESDIGNIHPGEPANVTVDAYPDRRFTGVVEKIEPQAVVQQNVTMFPVLVNLDNSEGAAQAGHERLDRRAHRRTRRRARDSERRDQESARSGCHGRDARPWRRQRSRTS